MNRQARTLGAVISSLMACACAPVAPADGRFASMTLLAFGDHGYHLGYLEPEDLRPPKSREAFLAAEREEWREDKRPPNDFKPSPMHQLETTGGYVAASGMMPVARAMKAYCRKTGCDAAVMLGDNIYPDGPTGGADGRDDATRFEEILRAPYHDLPTSDDFRIYGTLGNHDWRTSREAALAEARYMAATRPFYMDGLFYRVKPPAGKGEVEIFVLDTHVLLSGTTVYKDILADDGSEVETTETETPDPWAVPQTEAERNMVRWLEESLRTSDARWKIVVGHHPLWSSAGSKFQEARALRALILEPLCRYADIYLAGHEHTLEAHTDSCQRAGLGVQVPPLPQVVSGAAAKQRPLNTWFMAHQARKSPELATLYAEGMVWGFAHLSLGPDAMQVRIVSTPDDGGGSAHVEKTLVFPRRSGASAAANR